jgi:hypothetical protein
MKPKEIISSVGYEKGTFELVWPVNLQPSNITVVAKDQDILMLVLSLY